MSIFRLFSSELTMHFSMIEPMPNKIEALKLRR